MKQFIKIMFASMLGFVISGLVLVFIMVGVIAASIDSGEKEVKIEENSILRLSFNKGLIDKPSNNPFESFDFATMESNKPLGLKEVLDNIEKAKDDDNIEGIYLELKGVPMALANLDEVREALLDFRTSGKFIIAYGQYVDQGSYYLASVADKIYLYPEGDLEFKGLMSELTFFKGALEKLDVEMQIIRGKNNKFKSAVEPFIKDKMSDANREQIDRFLNSIWGVWLSKIAESRDLSVAQLNDIADSLASMGPQNAVDLGMIDGLLYGDEVIDTLMARIDVEEEDDMHLVKLGKYSKAPKKTEEDEAKPWELNDKVAVVYAAGEIRSGSSSSSVLGSKTIAQAIRKARKDSTVKAIVLRVNSPGGSALASDVIWRETQLAKKEKPFVVSMGGLAASGGYYISCGADRIFAGANTITGSIGVFGMIPYTEEFFSNKLGVTFDGTTTNANSNIGIATRKLTPWQHDKIQESVETVYATFLGRVSDGRGLTVPEVDSIGQGRVWTGKDALERGLVDELGGLNDAIAYAADMANLDDFRLKSYPEEKDPFETFTEELFNQGKVSIMESYLGDDFKYYQTIQRMKETSGIQARIPFDLTVY
ncbi:signal peptide peptidase SppA [bacterium SCSIO 12741]|nr:signal peptide peptidase SppA [bacterium SCSIO 12741]